MHRAEPARGLDALDAMGRGHADVRDHNIGQFPIDRVIQLVDRTAAGDRLEVVGGRDDAHQTPANEEVVLGDHQAPCGHSAVTVPVRV